MADWKLQRAREESCDDHTEFLTIETLLRDTDSVKMDLLKGLSRAMLDLATDISLGLAMKAWIAVVVCSCADITGQLHASDQVGDRAKLVHGSMAESLVPDIRCAGEQSKVRW